MSENYLNFLDSLVSFHGGGGDRDEDQTWNISIKILSIVLILALTVCFGFFPYFWYATL
jgi:hypothetical protein